MRRFWGRATVVAVVVASSGWGLAGAAPAVRTEPVVASAHRAVMAEPSNTLHTGQVLRPSIDDPSVSEIRSTNGRFRLAVYFQPRAEGATTGGGGLEIGQLEDIGVAGLWNRSAKVTPGVRALLQPNGNFVLYSAPGVALWSSRTAGTGTANRLVMRDDGNLVMYTAGGREVWSTGTHAELLPSGSTLAAGQYLSNAHAVGEPRTILTMQADGDLVLRYAGVVRWASNTTVPGAYLEMQSAGNLVIRSDSKVLWQSATGPIDNPEEGVPWLDVRSLGRFTVDFAPGEQGGAIESVFDSSLRPGETGRLVGGDLRFLTTRSMLRPGQTLASANGYRLTMQADGNLVQRGPRGTVRWQTRTGRHPGAVLRLRTDGLLAVVHDGRVLWSVRRHDVVSVALQSNGNLVAKDATGRVVWTSGTAR